MSATVTVTVREGRLGETARPSQLGGDVIMVFEAVRPMEVGDRLELPDGSVGRVERTMERSDSRGVSQTVVVVEG